MDPEKQALQTRSDDGSVPKRRPSFLRRNPAVIFIVLFMLARYDWFQWGKDTGAGLGDEIQGYWDGVVSKGARFALPLSSDATEEQQFAGFVPPKMAEKIFLSVPTNDSVAA